MKKETLFLILFFTSLLLFVPLLETAQEVTVVANLRTSIIYDVHTPTIKLTSSTQSALIVNITLLDLNSESSVIIYSLIEFTSSLTVNTDKPGYYLIELLSTELGVVKIKGTGIYNINIVIISLITIVNFYNLGKKLTKIQ